MALKITTPIPTDHGMIEEAYVRIGSYHITKYGYTTFGYEIFPSKATADSLNGRHPSINEICRNKQIGDVITVYPALNNNLDNSIDPTSYYQNNPIDFSIFGGDIFAYGYAALKTKLEGIVGEGNVVEC
jgi:hypothetical protein